MPWSRKKRLKNAEKFIQEVSDYYDEQEKKIAFQKEAVQSVYDATKGSMNIGDSTAAKRNLRTQQLSNLTGLASDFLEEQKAKTAYEKNNVSYDIRKRLGAETSSLIDNKPKALIDSLGPGGLQNTASKSLYETSNMIKSAYKNKYGEDFRVKYTNSGGNNKPLNALEVANNGIAQPYKKSKTMYITKTSVDMGNEFSEEVQKINVVGEDGNNFFWRGKDGSINTVSKGMVDKKFNMNQHKNNVLNQWYSKEQGEQFEGLGKALTYFSPLKYLISNKNAGRAFDIFSKSGAATMTGNENVMNDIQYTGNPIIDNAMQFTGMAGGFMANPEGAYNSLGNEVATVERGIIKGPGAIIRGAKNFTSNSKNLRGKTFDDLLNKAGGLAEKVVEKGKKTVWKAEDKITKNAAGKTTKAGIAYKTGKSIIGNSAKFAAGSPYFSARTSLATGENKKEAKERMIRDLKLAATIGAGVKGLGKAGKFISKKIKEKPAPTVGNIEKEMNDYIKTEQPKQEGKKVKLANKQGKPLVKQPTNFNKRETTFETSEKPVQKKINQKVTEIKEKVKTKSVQPTEIKETPKEFNNAEFVKEYGLNQDFSKLKPTERTKVANEVKHKLQATGGKRAIERIGSDDPRVVSKFYEKKYNLPKIDIDENLNSKTNPAKINIKRNKSGKIIGAEISINKSMPKENQIGALRHEIEHLKDEMSGYKSVERSNIKNAKNPYDFYAQARKGHHKKYNYFEADYLKDRLQKDFAENKGAAASEQITKTVDNTKIEEPKNTDKIIPKKDLDNEALKKTLDEMGYKNLDDVIKVLHEKSKNKSYKNINDEFNGLFEKNRNELEKESKEPIPESTKIEPENTKVEPEQKINKPVNNEKPYKGKTVYVDGEKAEFIGNRAGKAKVKLESGKTKTVEPHIIKNSQIESQHDYTIREADLQKNKKFVISKELQESLEENKKTIHKQLTTEEKIQYAHELTKDAEKIFEDHVADMKASYGFGKDAGYLMRDEKGNVFKRVGWKSRNELWYQKFRQEHKNHKPNMNDIREIADQQLREGFETEMGFEKPNDMYTFYRKEVENVLKDIEESKANEFKERVAQQQENIVDDTSRANLEDVEPEQEQNTEIGNTGVNDPGLNKISSGTEKPKKKWKERFFDKYEKFIDDYFTLHKAGESNFELRRKSLLNKIFKEKNMEKRKQLRKEYNEIRMDAESSQRKLAIYKSHNSTVDHMLTQQIVDMNGKPLNKNSFYKIMEAPKGMTQDQFFSYLFHRHNIDRFKAGKPVFGEEVTDKVSQDIIDAYEKAFPDVKEKANKYNDAWYEFTKEWLVNSGLVSKDLHTFLKDYYGNYINTSRVFEEKAAQEIAGNLRSKAILKEAKGGDQDILTPDISIPIMVQKIVRTARKNQVFQNFLSKVIENPENMRKYAEIVNIDKNLKANDGLEKIVAKIRDFKKMPGSTINELTDILDNPITQTKHDRYLTVMEQGQPVVLKINDDKLWKIFEKFDKFNGSDEKAVVNKFRWITEKFVKNFATKYNPFFGIRNVVRDVKTGALYSNVELKNYASNLGSGLLDVMQDTWLGGKVLDRKISKNIIKTVGKTYNPKTIMKYNLIGKMANTYNPELYQRYKALKGSAGNITDMTKKMVHMDVSMGRKVYEKALNFLNIVGHVSETSPRYAIFKSVLEEGGSIDEAIFQSNRGTTDFSRSGTYTKNIDAFVPYLNTSVQGLDQFIRNTIGEAVKHKNYAPLVKTVGLATIPSMIFYGMNRMYNSEKYDRLPGYVRDNNSVFFIGDKAIKIPKTRDTDMIASSLFERFFDTVTGNSRGLKDWKDYAAGLSTSFIPIDPLESFTAFPVTNILMGGNKDYFGRDIVPQYMLDKKLPKYLQYDDKTTLPSKFMGQLTKNLPIDKLKVSPKQLDYLIRSYAGFIGQFLGATYKAKGISDYPSNLGFATDTNYVNQNVTDFYDKYNAYKSKIAEIDALNADKREGLDMNNMYEKEDYLSSLSNKDYNAYTDAKEKIQEMDDIKEEIAAARESGDFKEIRRLVKLIK